MLRKVEVQVEEKSVEPGTLLTIVKQRPNKRVLGMPIYLWMYNLRDPAKVEAKRLRKDSLCMEENLRREARGRRARKCDNANRGRNGEPPVVLDPALTERGTTQIRLYMQKEGWFRASVHDTVYLHRRSFPWGAFRKPKADVVYRVSPGPVYTYRHIRTVVDDEAIAGYLRERSANSLLKPGDRFDADVLDDERARITALLRELGYLYFNRELVQYDADTTVADNQVDITLRIERHYAKRDRGLKGTPEGTIYHLDQVTLVTLRPTRTARAPADTVRYKGFALVAPGEAVYKAQALTGMVFLKPGERFRQSNADRTYRRLTGLRVFDRVEVLYDTTRTAPGQANARIDLLPGKEQNLSLEGFATNRGGFPGTSISAGYRHRNLFRSMGSLQLTMALGFEAQQPFTGSGSTVPEATTGGVAREGFFNTLDVGPELLLMFPHFLLPVRRDRFAKAARPSTAITVLYNLQQRPDYARSLGKVSFGYEWWETNTKSWGLYPMEVNVVRIPRKSGAFEDYLRTANDPVLTDSYTDHLIAGMRGVYTYNTQGSARQRSTFFARLSLEWAGHPLLMPLGWISQEGSDTSGAVFNTVAGIRYAEFVRADSDLRWRYVLHEKSSVAFRVAAGAGVPYGNLGVLPFESSFFMGGANGMRAWRARSLGPGSFSGPLLAFDRIGEIRLEGNAEYRFKLVGFLEGALFVDVGNIWTWNDDPRRPGGAIGRNMLADLAVGTGAGARLNFDFFILRFDIGMQTKDPSLEPGERWLLQPKDRFREQQLAIGAGPVGYSPQFNFNLGIGYPF